MLSALLTILKILGIVLLCLLGIILLLILLVLFIPVRYRIDANRKTDEDVPIRLSIKASWLLHIFSAAFLYPDEAFLRVRFFCFTIFRSDRSSDASDPPKKEKESDFKQREEKEEAASEYVIEKKEQKDIHDEETQQKETDHKEKIKKKNKIIVFFDKLWDMFKNIKYTITGICDKIKHIVKNIRYYLNILESDSFSHAWDVCGKQVLDLIRTIRPRKINGSLHIGTGDPAGTGQVLAIYGILYPLIGNHIDMVPDFENQILEGQLFAKGRITAFRILKTAWIVYFNKDLRRLIKLFKREAV